MCRGFSSRTSWQRGNRTWDKHSNSSVFPGDLACTGLEGSSHSWKPIRHKRERHTCIVGDECQTEMMMILFWCTSSTFLPRLKPKYSHLPPPTYILFTLSHRNAGLLITKKHLEIKDFVANMENCSWLCSPMIWFRNMFPVEILGDRDVDTS